MIVHKFGGSILADFDGLSRVAGQLRTDANDGPVIAVVSALKGLTDQLLLAIDRALGDQSFAALLDEFASRHEQVIAQLPGDQTDIRAELDRQVKQVRDRLSGIALLGQCPDAVRARIIVTGELLSSQTLATLLNAKDCTASSLDPHLLPAADEDFLDGVIDIEAAGANLRESVKSCRVLVVPGFVASNTDGKLVALGRNGTDYSAAVVAAAMNADALHLWKDVDGLFSADPRAVPAAQFLPHVSYAEAMELSYFGTGAIAAKAVAPLAARDIPCQIRNIDKPDHTGTLISGGDEDTQAVKGVTLLDHVALLPIEGPGMRGHIGMAGRIMDALAGQSISILLIVQSSSEYNITLCVRSADARRAERALRDEFSLERTHGLIKEISHLPERAVVTLVGDGMKHRRGLAARFLTAVSAADANVEAIAQGSSECAIGVVMRRGEAKSALRAVHDSFFGGVQKLDVILLGCGNVGAALLEQFRRQQASLIKQNIEIRVHGIANSRKLLTNDGAIDLENWQAALERDGRAYSVEEFSSLRRELGLLNPIIVDCTSSQTLSDQYADFLDDGFNVVAANKKANTSSQAYYQRLRDSANRRLRRFMYETNVGAGLPVIDNLQSLLRSGDEVLRFQGILSGSLSALFGFLDDGMTFSAAVNKIVELGYTEPNPRDDLSGMDVARKLLIIAREIGLEMELDDIEVEAVIDPSFAPGTDKPELLAALPQLDDEFAKRISTASNDGKVLRYVAELSDGHCKVAVAAVGSDEPLAAIRDGENALALFSRYYNPIPMVLRGYGAGAEVTAAGVFGDVLRTQWRPLDL